MANNLHSAKLAKKDEFYTQLSDIENELCHYTEHFRDKVVLCNCDDPRVSAFFEYFSKNFEFLGLRRLISTCYKNVDCNLFSQNLSQHGIRIDYTGGLKNGFLPTEEDIEKGRLNGDGDFRSRECIEILQQADIVVTNPPFSLFREYVAQLERYNKKFLIIGHQNAITYKEIFPLIKNNKIGLDMVSKAPQVISTPSTKT